MVKKIIKTFKVKISNCGSHQFSCGFDIMKNTNALKLTEQAIFAMAEGFVSKEMKSQFIFTLGMSLLKMTHKQFDKILDSDKLDKLIEVYEMEGI